MDKEILQIRLKSIEHFNEEERRFNYALKEVIDTRRNIVNSLVEACEWKCGQVLFDGQRMIKVHSVDAAHIYGDDEVRIHFTCFKQNREYGFSDSISKENILLSELDKWVVIVDVKNPE